MRLGIMGGTFDPIHYGHLVAAEMTRYKFNLSKVLFIPTGKPPHKLERETAAAEQRLAMIKEAIRDNAEFDISTLELEREGPSYTVDTLRILRGDYPEHQLYFITGTDALLHIFSWYKSEEIFKLTEVIGVARPGFDLTDFILKLKQEHSDDRSRIHYVEVPALAISSTDIRERVRNGQSIRYLLPEAVRQIIIRNRLYEK